MIVLIDNGHGANTPGKCSPDGRLKEYKSAREIAKLTVDGLKAKGVNAILLVPEENDISLKERCKRANKYCEKYGAKNVLLVSIHHNAAGADGKWHEARGFSAHVSLNASGRSKALAQYLWSEALMQGLKGNRSVPEVKYIAQNLAICRDTRCAAVLTENLFQDNKDDVEFLLDDEGKNKVATMHVTAINEYIKDYG
jgi:N-acetylmuramoyl-L-alanine amidase